MSNEHPGESATGPSIQGPQGPQGRRPSLNAGGGSGHAALPSGPGEPSTSILQALSNTMQMEPVSFTAPRPVAWKPWAAGAVVLAVAAAAWTAFVGTRSAQPETPSRVTAEVQQPPVAKAVEPVATLASASPASVGAAASAVARIEDLPPGPAALSAAAVADATPLASASASPSAVVAAKPSPAARPDAPAARPRVARLEPRPEARTEARSEAPRRKDVKLAMVDGRTGESPSQAAARSASTSTATRQDSDVDLMAALLDHMAATEAGRTDAATPGVRKAAAATRAVPATTARPLTISGLVGSCKDAGDKRAVSECRKRICKGYWGKAEACPARLAPTAAARKRSAG